MQLSAIQVDIYARQMLVLPKDIKELLRGRNVFALFGIPLVRVQSDRIYGRFQYLNESTDEIIKEKKNEHGKDLLRMQKFFYECYHSIQNDPDSVSKVVRKDMQLLYAAFEMHRSRFEVEK